MGDFSLKISIMTLLLQNLRESLPMIIAAQIVLFALAILVGGFLILRRVSRRPPLDSQILEEKEKLAAEIHTEILRLRDLRDRLFDGFGEAAEKTFHSKPQQQTPLVGANDGAREAELVKLNAELMKTTEELRAKITSLEAALAAAPKTLVPVAAADAMTPAKLDEIKKEIAEIVKAEMGEKITLQETTIKDLSTRLEEYEIFEEELAQIKKYKSENEVLKQQVSAVGASPAGAEFSEDDIAKLFNEMSGSTDVFAEPVVMPGPESSSAEPVVLKEEAKAPEPIEVETPKVEVAAEPPVVATPLLEPASEGSLDDELEKFIAAGGGAETLVADAKPGAKEPAPDLVVEAATEEPDVIAVDAENAEAMAMLGGDQDELMKEFEKVLAPPPGKEK